MTSLDPSVIHAVKELIRIDNEIRKVRSEQKRLNDERSKYREIILEHHLDETRFNTPYGDIVVKDRESVYKFSLEDIRNIFDSLKERFAGNILDSILRIFETEADRNSRSTRVLSVRRPQTMKRKQRNKHSRVHNKTMRQNTFIKDEIEHTDSSV